MESKKQSGKQMKQFLEGHGFYMVMLLCAAIIGVSIWSLLKKPTDFSPDEPEFDETLSEVLPAEYEPEMPVLIETESEEKEQKIEETASELTEVWPV